VDQDLYNWLESTGGMSISLKQTERSHFDHRNQDNINMKTLPSIFVLTAASLAVSTSYAQQRTPNIVLIFMDDMGYGDASQYKRLIWTVWLPRAFDLPGFFQPRLCFPNGCRMRLSSLPITYH